MSFQHPLDPLSHGEQELIVAHSRKAWNLQDHHLFAMLQLHEPTKAELSSGKKLDRTARVTIWDRKKAVVSEGLIQPMVLLKSLWRFLELNLRSVLLNLQLR